VEAADCAATMQPGADRRRRCRHLRDPSGQRIARGSRLADATVPGTHRRRRQRLGRPRYRRQGAHGLQGAEGVGRSGCHHLRRRRVRVDHCTGGHRLPNSERSARHRHRRPGHRRSVGRAERHRRHLPTGRVELAGVGLQRVARVGHVGSPTSTQREAHRGRQGRSVAFVPRLAATVRRFPRGDPEQGLQDQERRNLRVPLHRDITEELLRHQPRQPVQPLLRVGG